MPRVPEPAELADDISEIKQQLASLLQKLEQSYVPRELYEARHLALRNEVALEFASLKAEMETKHNGLRNEIQSSASTAGGARALSLWCLGILGTAVIVALVGFVATGGAA